MTFEGRRWPWFASALLAMTLTACTGNESSPTPTMPAVPTVTVTVSPSPPATEVINVRALNEQGRVLEGYVFDDESEDPDVEAEQCSEPSGAGVSPNTYACGSSVYSADACWRHAKGDLACLDMPWDRQLYLRSISGELPDTPKAEDPQPLGLQLEDGSRYRQRNGMGVGIAPGDLNDVYICASGPCGDDPSKTFVVFDTGDKPTIDASDDAWTVLVGQMLRDKNVSVPRPETQRVVRAWYITVE